MITWTKELIERLISLNDKAYCITKIAQHMGDDRITRNSVMGKMTRLGLRLKSLDLPKVKKPRKSRAKPKPVVVAKPAPKPKAKVIKPPSSGQLYKFLELENYQCRYPTGDPRSKDFGFCGARIQEGKPYCAYHEKLCHVPTHPIRKYAAYARPRPSAAVDKHYEGMDRWKS
jgi:GcrA cell cycle regulator